MSIGELKPARSGREHAEMCSAANAQTANASQRARTPRRNFLLRGRRRGCHLQLRLRAARARRRREASPKHRSDRSDTLAPHRKFFPTHLLRSPSRWAGSPPHQRSPRRRRSGAELRPLHGVLEQLAKADTEGAVGGALVVDDRDGGHAAAVSRCTTWRAQAASALPAQLTAQHTEAAALPGWAAMEKCVVEQGRAVGAEPAQTLAHVERAGPWIRAVDTVNPLREKLQRCSCPAASRRRRTRWASTSCASRRSTCTASRSTSPTAARTRRACAERRLSNPDMPLKDYDEERWDPRLASGSGWSSASTPRRSRQRQRRRGGAPRTRRLRDDFWDGITARCYYNYRVCGADRLTPAVVTRQLNVAAHRRRRPVQWRMREAGGRARGSTRRWPAAAAPCGAAAGSCRSAARARR